MADKCDMASNQMTNRELYLLTECMDWQTCSHKGCKTRREIARLAQERDDLKIWWERDSKGLGTALGELATLRAVKEDQRALLSSKERTIDHRGLRNALGGLPLEGDGLSDTLAVALCSYFSRHRKRPALDPETENGWGEWVERKADEALDYLVKEVVRVTSSPVESSAPETSAPHEPDGCLDCLRIERSTFTTLTYRPWSGNQT